MNDQIIFKNCIGRQILFANYFYIMNTSLHLSMLSADEELEQADNNEIEILETRINEVRTLLEKMDEDSKFRQQRCEQELASLSYEIQEARRIKDEELEKQALKYENKKNEVIQQFEDDKLKFEQQYNNLIKQSEQYNKKFDDILMLHDEYRTLNEQRKEVVEEFEALEAEKKAQQEQLQKTLARKLIVFQYQQQILRLEREISNLHATRREIENDFKIKRAELLNKYDVSLKDHNILIKKLTKDMNDRDNEYQLHLNIVKMQVQKEDRLGIIENHVMEMRIKRMRDVSALISRNCSRHIATINKDLENMQLMFKEAQEEEKNVHKETLDRGRTLYLKEKAAQLIRQNATSIENDLSNTSALNTFASTITSATNQRVTPTRSRSKKQAIFT